MLGALLAAGCVSTEPEIPSEPYEPTWESLARHEAAPEWFMDAKFGIYLHWGVMSVPAFAHEWYPRRMHEPGTPVYEHHVATYGPPEEFGYHDFVPRFTAERYDPDAWAALFHISSQMCSPSLSPRHFTTDHSSADAKWRHSSNTS